MTRIIDGGIIWPSVPDAQIVPVEISTEYPRRSIVGNDSSPIVTTVAPTIPVLAASNIPTSVTAIPSPPRSDPKSALSVSSKSSAIRARSRVTPMKTNSGTATSVSLPIMPKTRFGRPDRRASLNVPVATPAAANTSAVPPSVNATGKPASNTAITVRNSRNATHSIVQLPLIRATERSNSDSPCSMIATGVTTMMDLRIGIIG